MVNIWPRNEKDIMGMGMCREEGAVRRGMDIAQGQETCIELCKDRETEMERKGAHALTARMD